MIICFLDTETTGFSEVYNDLIQLSAIIYDTTTREEIETFDEYIRPRTSIPKEITELTGITNKDVENGMSNPEVLRMFWAWCEIHNVDLLAGHNIAAFDQRFLYKKSDMLHIEHKNYPLLDTIKIARDLKKRKICKFDKVNQPAIAKYFNIEYDAHNSLNDVRALIKIYYKFLELGVNEMYKKNNFNSLTTEELIKRKQELEKKIASMQVIDTNSIFDELAAINFCLGERDGKTQ